LSFSIKLLNILTAIITIFILNAQAKDNFFITNQEYGKMLYFKPRGIGCNLCHGKNGEGFLILKYKHKGEDLTLSAPSITHLTYKKFKKSLLNFSVSIMPNYNLTDTEIHTLYSYLASKDLNVTRR